MNPSRFSGMQEPAEGRQPRGSQTERESNREEKQDLDDAQNHKSKKPFMTYLKTK